MEQILATPPPAQTRTTSRALYRFNSIDLLRGLIMIIMALDHTRDYFHAQAFTGDPLNLQTTTPWLFLTRWITHFCAPVFVFLAGTSAFFQSSRKSKKELSYLLITRGFWLIVVELVIFNFAFSFDPGYHYIGLQTLWSIGISMVFLGLVVYLPFAAILGAGLVIVLGHNALDFYEAGKQGNFPVGYSLLHHFGFYQFGGNRGLFILYPFLPWTGLMFLGYCFGKLYLHYEGTTRRNVLTWLGLGIVLFFILLRYTNLYGNPGHWQAQKNTLYTIFSFIDNQKYPPSLLYMCMTIGPAILFLAWAGTARRKMAQVITVYGRVPFFYYVLHFFLLHLLTSIFYLLRGHSFAEGTSLKPLQPFFTQPGEGYSLGIVYLVWILVVVALYPLCKWFSQYKSRHRAWWLSYV